MMPPDDSSHDDPVTSAAVAAMFTETQTGSVLEEDWSPDTDLKLSRSVGSEVRTGGDGEGS